MSNRFLLKQFASSATNNCVFGSFKEGDYTYTSDVDALQSLTAWAIGWLEATDNGTLLPRLEEMQGLQFVLCKAIKEIYSEGIPEWLSSETYYKGSFVYYNDAVYFNYTGTFGTANPASDTANWRMVIDCVHPKGVITYWD